MLGCRRQWAQDAGALASAGARCCASSVSARRRVSGGQRAVVEFVADGEFGAYRLHDDVVVCATKFVFDAADGIRPPIYAQRRIDGIEYVADAAAVAHHHNAADVRRVANEALSHAHKFALAARVDAVLAGAVFALNGAYARVHAEPPQSARHNVCRFLEARRNAGAGRMGGHRPRECDCV